MLNTSPNLPKSQAETSTKKPFSLRVEHYPDSAAELIFQMEEDGFESRISLVESSVEVIRERFNQWGFEGAALLTIPDIIPAFVDTFMANESPASRPAEPVLSNDTRAEPSQPEPPEQSSKACTKAKSASRTKYDNGKLPYGKLQGGEKKPHKGDYPCPICKGRDEDQRGQGDRCHGYTSGDYVNCSHADHAGKLTASEYNLYGHVFYGKCKCGVTHNTWPADRRLSKRASSKEFNPKRTSRKKTLVKFWPYIQDGKTQFEACRYKYDDNGEKCYFMRYLNDNNRYIYKGVFKARKKIVYRLDELKASPPKQTIFVTEGEKCVDAMTGINCLATTTPMGAANPTQTIKNCLGVFKDRNVCILPDNDEPGAGYADKWAAALWGTAKSIKVVLLPDLEDKDDVYDWLEGHGGTREKLRDLVKSAPKLTEADVPKPEEKSKNKPLQEPPEPPTPAVLDYIASKAVWTEAQCVAYLNAMYAVVNVGSNVRIMKQEHDSTTGQVVVTKFIKRYDFDLLYVNKTVLVPQDDKLNYETGEYKKQEDKPVPAPKYWLESPLRRGYDDIVYVPTEDTAVLQKLVGGKKFNLWSGFACKPVKGNCEPWKQHLLEVVCSGSQELYAYLWEWCAQAVQQPMDRPGTAIVLQGKQGTGKGTLALLFGKLWGIHYLYLNRDQHLTGNFNSHHAAKSFVFADENTFGGDKKTAGVLKSIVTEPELPVERKGVDIVKMPNYLRIIIASNNAWIVPAGLEERRFCVIEASDKILKLSPKERVIYFDNIYDCMGNGGNEALLYELSNHKLGSVNLRAIPQTAALDQQKFLGMTPTERYWVQVLEDQPEELCGLEWGENIPAVNLYWDFLEGKYGSEKYNPSMRTFILEIKKMCPGAESGRAYANVRISQDNRIADWKQAKCISFPSLAECRKQWDKTQTKWNWADNGGENNICETVPDSDMPAWVTGE